MNFDEIPYELKEYIFTYVTPNEWINTAKVSKKWLELTLGCIKKVESCHVLILDHLAEFMNQQRNTNYTWISLLTLMPKLEHLECIENTEAFWREIKPVCLQLKILDLQPKNNAFFDGKKLDISFDNLVELHWYGTYQGPAFLFRIFELAPKLETLTLKCFQINAEWKKKIPKSVKHILMHLVTFSDDDFRSVDYLCQDASVVETFSAQDSLLPWNASSKFFDETRRLKNLGLEFMYSDAATSTIIENALKSCQDLTTVRANGAVITDTWRRLIPKNVRSLMFYKMKVQKNIRRDFSLDWLFQNYSYLQCLELKTVDWTGLDSQKFHSNANLKKLHLDNYMKHFVKGRDESMDPFADICFRMNRGSHLVHVEICELNIDASFRHIFPPTIKRLKLKGFHLSKEAQLVFSPQFICENPSNIESLILDKFHSFLPAIDLNAFTGMQMLRELQMKDLCLFGDCLQSILTHCSALTNLLIGALTAGALTNIPRNLVLPSLRKLDVNGSIDQPSWLLQHFPKLCTLDISIGPSEEFFSGIVQAMQDVETVEIKIWRPNWGLVRSSIGSIDDEKFKYFCLTCDSVVVSFYLTNSLLHACSKLNDTLIFKERHNVLLISDNYPSSPLLRKHVSRIPSSIDEVSQQYYKLVVPESDDLGDSDEDW